MRQFSVYHNANPATKAVIPYLLNVQSDLIAELHTRVAVPLYLLSAMKGKTLRILMPIFEIEGVPYVMMTPELAGVPVKSLGGFVTDLDSKRDEIMAALDFLITGI